MDNRGRSGYEEEINLYAKGGIERGGDIAISQYTSGGT